jgi:hypothetical protein
MKFKSICRKCAWPYLPDNRHVSDLGVEDCVPADNLEYLEYVLNKKEKRDETPRPNP